MCKAERARRERMRKGCSRHNCGTDRRRSELRIGFFLTFMLAYASPSFFMMLCNVFSTHLTGRHGRRTSVMVYEVLVL